MRQAALVACVLTALVTTGCGSHEGADAASVSAERAEVEKATAAFHDALRNNDLERFMSYVGDDVRFMPAGEPPTRGKAALRSWMEGFLARYRTTTLRLADREVMVGNGWAVELGTYEWALAPAVGGTPAVDRGHYMQVWQQQPDKTWRFAREVYNSSVPAAPAAPPAPAMPAPK
jgi:ketosteroid isomerase-like protein